MNYYFNSRILGTMLFFYVLTLRWSHVFSTAFSTKQMELICRSSADLPVLLTSSLTVVCSLFVSSTRRNLVLRCQCMKLNWMKRTQRRKVAENSYGEECLKLPKNLNKNGCLKNWLLIVFYMLKIKVPSKSLIKEEITS